jgi:FlaA1/EpsC-like NDP-sugar epimerase
MRSAPQRILNGLVNIPRSSKRLIMASSDAVAFPLSLWLAHLIRFEAVAHASQVSVRLFVVAAMSALIVNPLLGLYRTVVRFQGPQVGFHALASALASMILVGAASFTLVGTPLGWGVLSIYALLTVLYLAGSRFLARYLFFRFRNTRQVSRVAIYGAGDAGSQLSSMLLGDASFLPVLFVDDKAALRGSRINGIRVISPAELPAAIADLGIDRILLAVPSASRYRRREILSKLEPLGIHVQSMPDLREIIAGNARIDELREVDVNDLLGRDPVPPDVALFESCIRGKSVLVTGAGGSIGGELCRQILKVSPKRLILLEMSELALYSIERELSDLLRREGLSVEIVPLLGNAHHRHRMRDVLASYKVQTVYHAAAYKHVPIVEHNVVEGIHNNVVSTWYTAEAALEAGVETFVLISTDKAVNPANVMGATKRMAELVLQALQQRTTATRFCMVRFGNVLASSGSVVPLFREQIRMGGPVTVTHPDVIRYFMTIPEAAQLVIQAGSMATGGDVFVLDMGRPVRIDDLARRLISLMGFTVRDAANPDGDIEIKYTGLRAAEKLYEELLIGSNVAGTHHPMILRAMEHSIPWERMNLLLVDLLGALSSFDCRRSIAVLADAVAEYKVVPELRDHVWTRKARDDVAADDKKVAPFASKRRVSEGAPRN